MSGSIYFLDSYESLDQILTSVNKLSTHIQPIKANPQKSRYLKRVIRQQNRISISIVQFYFKHHLDVRMALSPTDPIQFLLKTIRIKHRANQTDILEITRQLDYPLFTSYKQTLNMLLKQ